MANKELTDVVGHAVGRIARGTIDNVSSTARKASHGPLAGPKGLAAGAGLVALAPFAARGAGKLFGQTLNGGASPVKKVREKASDVVEGSVKDAVGKKIDQAGGAGGVAKEAGKSLLPGMGNGKSDDGGGGQSPDSGAIGNGRRMPVQQAVDVAVPITTVYNQWTQFEEWPNFMHRLDRVTQEDETHVSFKAKFWGISREFTAEIVDQRPDERIKWQMTDGVSHTGVVTFHELSDRLTRVEVDVDIQPGSLLEKAGRGMRHAKRGIRADLSRFKAYMELEEEATGAWRGKIDDGEVKSTRRSSSSRRRGSQSRAASSGSRSKTASSGSRSKAASSASRSKAASSGSRSKAASSGSRSKTASSGSRSANRSSGQSKSSGSRSRSGSGASNSGKSASSSSRSSSNRSRAASNGRTSSSGRKPTGSRS
jgi:uncharacterized membrane protein